MITFRSEHVHGQQLGLFKIVTWLLLGLGVLSFFLPLVSLKAPIVGNVDWSALNVVSGIFQSHDVEGPSFQGIIKSKQDSNPTDSDTIPLSIRQAVLFPFAVLLAYVAICSLAGAEFIGSLTTYRKHLGISGMICSLFGLLSIFLLSNGLREQMRSGLDGTGTDSSPFSALASALVQSVKIEPGSGLYLLAFVTVLIFLVHKMSTLDFLEYPTNPSSILSEASKLSLQTGSSNTTQRIGMSRTMRLVGVGGIVVVILTISIYTFKNSTPTPAQAREQLAKLTIQYDVDSFIAAAYKDNTKVASLLPDAGMNPNERDEKGNTALIAAVAGKMTTTARMLIARGASVNVKTDDGFTPLLYAVRDVDLANTMLLLDRGADINSVGLRDLTPLMSAVMAHQTGQLKLLLDRGADPNRKANNGFTALMFAAGDDSGSSGEMVRLLLARGADVNSQVSGRTALFIASQSGHSEVVDLLKKAGAKDSF